MTASRISTNSNKNLSIFPIDMSKNSQNAVVQSSDLLLKMLSPYTFVIKWLGTLPLKIHKGGQVSFKMCSWSTFHTFINFCIMMIISWLLLPMFVYVLRAQEAKDPQGVLNFVAQLIFGGCQFLGAWISYIILPWSVPKLVILWNAVIRLSSDVSKLATPNLSSVTSVLTSAAETLHPEFYPVCRSSRIKIQLWLLACLSFNLFCQNIYCKNVHEFTGHGPSHYLHLTACLTLVFIVSFHILNSILFITFSSLLSANYRALRRYAEKLGGECISDRDDRSVFNLYKEINSLVALLGEVFGLFVILEIVIMMICIVVNLFFLISQISEPNSRTLTVIIVVLVPYAVWFQWICGAGEELKAENLLCYESLRMFGTCQADKMASKKWKTIQRIAGLSAHGYLTIDNHLLTSVIGTITTYLVVMLQFKMSSFGEANWYNYLGNGSIFINDSHKLPNVSIIL